MSSANYYCSCEDHAKILVSIQTGGNILESDFQAALSKIKKYEQIKIVDAGRTVHFKFQRDVSLDNCQWSSFQMHRRMMGLIILAECSSAIDVALLHEIFQKKKETYSDFIFDSRCFVFGIDQALLQQNKPGMFQFSSVEKWTSVETDVKDFLTSVFYVLESKRLQIAAEKSERPPLLSLPFERAQSSNPLGFDSDSRSQRRKATGRWKKHLADVSLLAGCLLDALAYYHSAIDILLSAGDQLWSAAAIEGLCAASSIVLYPEQPVLDVKEEKSVAPQPGHQMLDARNLQSSKLTSQPSKSDLMKFCIQTPDDFISRYKEAVISYTRNKNMGVVELEACIKATKTIALMQRHIDAAEFLQNAVYINFSVTDAERITRYSALAELYERIDFHRKAAFYCRVAAMQCVSPQLEAPDWQQCYTLLQRGMRGFGIALHSDAGIPRSGDGGESGWAMVRVKVLNELIFSCRRIGENKSATRLMIYMLMRVHEHLSENEEKEMCQLLDQCVSLAKQSSDDVQQRKIDISGVQLYDGTLLPTLHLYTLPALRMMKPQPLCELHLPCSYKTDTQSQGIFIFAPKSYRSNQKTAFKWCARHEAEVSVTLHNPLKVSSLRVAHLRLLCEMQDDDADTRAFDCPPLTLDLAPATTRDATLTVVPRRPGVIVIKGYQATVFGVESRCYLQHMTWIDASQLDVRVTPELPLLERTSRQQLTPSHIQLDEDGRMSVSFYPGENATISVPVKNAGNTRVDVVDCVAVVTSRKRDDVWMSVACRPLHLPLAQTDTADVVLDVSARFPASCQLESPACACEVKLKYSNEGAVKENWCRELRIHLLATLRPCVVVRDIVAACTSRQEWARLTISLENVLSGRDDLVTITCGASHPDVIRPVHDHVFQCEAGRVVMVAVRPGETATAECLMRTLTEVCGDDVVDSLNRQLDLMWKTGDNETSRSGKLDLKFGSHNPTRPEQLINLIRSPLHWAMHFNEVDMTEVQPCVTTVVGEACPLRCVITNVTSEVIPTIELDLEIFQDQENGFREWNMDNVVLCIGCQSQDFSDVEAGQSCEFECVLMFLLPGEFHVRLNRIRPQPHHGDSYDATSIETSTRSEVNSYHEWSPTVVVRAEDPATS